MVNRLIRFFLENRLIAWLLMIFFIGWGIAVAPFNWDTGFLPRDPVPVDAIPDIGENQQIIFTEWMGRSPQDIEDQITYPAHLIATWYSRGDQHTQHLYVRFFQYICDIR
jgi:copper/silver efflux system protein